MRPDLHEAVFDPEELRDLLQILERSGIADPRVLDAIALTPRDAFISESALKQFAYADEALPIECEQTISQPFIVAYMTERLNATPDSDVLEIGTGSGYQTAILSRLARHVFTIEYRAPLHRLAVDRFRRLGLGNITAVQGDGTKGWPEQRRFNRIIVTAGTDEVPRALLDQLAPCGIMVIPLGPAGDQRVTLIVQEGGREHYQRLLAVRFVSLMSDEG
jgi:protein-L-isoaspartate(D-aspartate) O-methyltransferase